MDRWILILIDTNALFVLDKQRPTLEHVASIDSDDSAEQRKTSIHITITVIRQYEFDDIILMTTQHRRHQVVVIVTQ